MSKEERFEIFNEDGKWVIKDNEQLPHLLDLYKSCVRLNEFADKIADLEAKLAESEEEIKQYENAMVLDYTTRKWRKIGDIQQENNQLKQQLTEKDQAIESWKTMYESVMQTCNNDLKEIERSREQLAEKEKELDLEKFFFDLVNNPKGQQTIKKINQDKISFSVEQLENVKSRIQEDFDYDDLMYWLNKQIEQLKDGK